MIKLKIKEIANIIAADINNLDPEMDFIGNFEYDSRNIKLGDIFIALNGENTSGLKFATQAMAKGAVAILSGVKISQPNICLRIAESADNDAELILALNKLAEYNVTALQNLGLKVIGITGSAGKTSTKDFLTAILAKVAETVAPPESFNNELGMAWTALKASETTKYLILEMSTRHLGDIEFQAKVAHPQIGALVSIGNSHLETLGTIENVAKAKGELLQALPAKSAGGIAVLNFDDEWIRKVSPLTAAEIVSVGVNSAENDIYGEIIADNLAASSFIVHFSKKYNLEAVNINLNIPGKHFVVNALIAIGIAIKLGISLEIIKSALAAVNLISQHRMHKVVTKNGFILIDDAYNSNPESASAAIKTLIDLKIKSAQSVWLVLGEMKELGENAVKLHNQVVMEAVELGIDNLICVGDTEVMQEMYKTAVNVGRGKTFNVELFSDKEQAEKRLLSALKPGDTVLFKASNSIRLWTIFDNMVNFYTGEN